MSDLIVEAPVNNLSLGNVSFNILREIYKRGAKVCFFPIGEVNLSSFDKIDSSFAEWMQKCYDNRYHNLKKDTPTLKVWHINGAENRIGSKQYLFTFFEVDRPSFPEKNILSLQEEVFLSNPEACEVFEKVGCKNVSFCPLGFDTDNYRFGGGKLVENKTHFILMGKFEKRKHTKKIIKAWLKRYGNNNKYLLSCCVTNPFLQPEQMSAIYQDCLGGERYSNVNFLPYLKTNSEVNHLINSADIDLTGLSGAEGWNLPAFNATALGKWSIVYNHTAHKAWATKDNCVLLEPMSKEPAEDGIFFSNTSLFNNGNIYGFDEDTVIAAMERAESKATSVNVEGMKLQTTHTYSKTVDAIFNKMSLRHFDTSHIVTPNPNVIDFSSIKAPNLKI